ncbi:peptidoglycan bridge formation glycyltransferase FemA/FemB family protein [Patescibacteria group bacterium]|nr:peptidoglycan bridge formation glycyltransferase FemA/FemB family protein [Patescibacteria group bacterium]
MLDKDPKLNNSQEFLQSSIWEKIVKNGGEETARLEQVLLISKKIYFPLLLSKLKFFSNLNYQYSPRGPIISRAEDFWSLAEKIREKFKPIFFRFEPELELMKNLTSNKYKLKKTIDLQPRQTLLIDLSLSEEEILKAMSQKTRYNIRLAAKKGIEIVEAGSELEKEFKEFWRLMKLTSNRDGFKIHSEAHYRNLLTSSEGIIKLFFAEFEGQKIATGLFAFYGDKVIYLHGASDNEFRNLMAPYLLQFEIIKKAKADGFKFYDFYGIDAEKWPGVTRFKKGFAGFVYNYAGTYDLIFRPWLYFFYNLLRRLRRSF